MPFHELVNVGADALEPENKGGHSHLFMSGTQKSAFVDKLADFDRLMNDCKDYDHISGMPLEVFLSSGKNNYDLPISTELGKNVKDFIEEHNELWKD